METVQLKRALTRWLVLQRSGKLPSTRRYYKEIVRAIRRVWRDILTKSVDQVNADDIARLSLRFANYSATRWNAIVTVIHATVTAGKDLKRRPVKLTRPPPPTHLQFASLLQHCDLKRTELVVDFLAHSGLRISGARRVRWADVYEDRIEYVGKGGRVCSVPMINGMRGVLARLRELQDGSGYVLPRPAIKRSLATACKRAGIRRLTHHDFRHLFTTRCIESGVDIPTVARWRGDSDGGAMLMKRYFHLQDAHSQLMARRVRL